MPRKKAAPPSVSADVYRCTDCGNNDPSEFVTDYTTDDRICRLCGTVCRDRAFSNYELEPRSSSSYFAPHYWRERIRQLWMEDSEPIYLTNRFSAKFCMYFFYPFAPTDYPDELVDPRKAKSFIKRILKEMHAEKETPKLNYLEKWIKLRAMGTGSATSNHCRLQPNYEVIGPDGFRHFINELDDWYRKLVVHMRDTKPPGRRHNCNINMLLQVGIFCVYGGDAWMEARDYLHIIENAKKCQQTCDWIERILSRTGQLDTTEFREVIVNYWQNVQNPKLGRLIRRQKQTQTQTQTTKNVKPMGQLSKGLSDPEVAVKPDDHAAVHKGEQQRPSARRENNQQHHVHGPYRRHVPA